MSYIVFAAALLFQSHHFIILNAFEIVVVAALFQLEFIGGLRAAELVCLGMEASEMYGCFVLRIFLILKEYMASMFLCLI